jgi:serine/threonine protein kinase
MIGQLLGDYELQQVAGRGPSATVYVARQHPVERYVAVKILEPQSREVANRLRELSTTMADLDHTHVLPVYDSGRWQDRYYWVMRYMPAGSLKTRLGKQRLTLEEIDRVLPQIASALDYARQRGLVHGDLKFTDVLIDHAGQAFVTDFGVAVALNRPAETYQTPELRRGEAPDARTDVYGLGAILYELLTLRPPLDPRAPAEERANRRLVPPAPGAINSKLPRTLDAVVLQALAVDPDQRYATPGDLVEAYVQARVGKKAATVVAAPVAAAATVAAVTMVDTRVRRVSVRRAESEKKNRWKIAGLIGGILIGLLVIIGVISLASQTPAAVAPRLTETPRPTATPLPTTTVTTQPSPSASPTVPTSTATRAPTSPPATSTTAARSTATPIITRAATRLLSTATPALSIAPLTLVFPRSEGRDNLSLAFQTNVVPANAGIIGTLSIAVPAVESYVLDRTLAQVGSGEQVLRVTVSINCGKVTEPITSQQIILTLRDEKGKVLLTQSVAYEKRWCE